MGVGARTLTHHSACWGSVVAFVGVYVSLRSHGYTEEPWTAARAQDQTPFAHALLARFGLAEGYINLNHCSFGTLAKQVREVQRAYVHQVCKDKNGAIQAMPYSLKWAWV